MNLWIRSQDKERLTIIQDFYIEKEQDYVNHRIDFVIYGINLVNDDVRLGTYISKERALEVLDEIQNTVYINKLFNADIGAFKRSLEIEGYTESEINNALKKISTYEMPKE